MQQEQEYPTDEQILDELGIDDIKAPNYVQSWKQGRETVTQLSAEGIFQIANRLGLSIVKCEIILTEDGKHYRGEAIAQKIETGQTMFGHAEIPLYFKSGTPNANAYELTSTNAQRNALKKFIPQKQISAQLSESQSEVNTTKISQTNNKINQTNKQNNYLENIKNETRELLRKAKPNIEKLGLTVKEVHSAVQERQGAMDSWDHTKWNKFKTALTNLNSSWIKDLVQKEEKASDTENVVEPETKSSEPVKVNEEVVTTPTESEPEPEPKSEVPVKPEPVATQTEPVTTENEEANGNDLRKKVANLLASRKEVLESLGIDQETFWRFGVANQYGVKSSQELTEEDWKHLERSLLIPDFAEWIRKLSKKEEPNNEQDEPPF